MIAQYFGKYYSLQTLREKCYITREGVSLQGISTGAEQIGFRTVGCKLSFEQLDDEATLPCILFWNKQHFVVLPPQNYNRKRKSDRILIADPANGMMHISKDVFLKSWATTDDKCGIALLLEPTPLFYSQEGEQKQSIGFSFLFRYLPPYKKYIYQLFLGMLVGSILSLIFPFLTQSLVDYGINQQNIGFVYLILISQLVLFLGNTAIGLIQNWIMLHMNTRVNISIISDFLLKLMKLPIRFFDTKMVGDITQRISDHNRIEQFLTSTSLNTVFSFVNLAVFSIVLSFYSLPILIIFTIGSAFSITWITIFLKRRRDLDYARFQGMSDNQNNIYEIITGMQDIKLNSSETSQRWGWERVQAKLFKVSIKSLRLEQYQMIGAGFFSQLQSILISFVSARQVMSGNITLGMMMSVSYIVGQMSSPIQQFLGFLRSAQDAKISMERLSEIHLKEDEEKEGTLKPDNELLLSSSENGIVLEEVSFQYGDPGSSKVLDNINLVIPYGKVTAIVGASGSGKTTLMKLLLKFYEPQNGKLFINKTPLNIVSPKWWRDKCGVVMQDGHIFSGTIAQNIAVNGEPDVQKLLHAVHVANISDFIYGLPLGFSSKIGNTGNGISAGQKQRILIARAVYKDPSFIFLDEATSALDANNEKSIIENLNEFFRGKTVMVIAHRLSTVKHADQIVVLENGKLVELGSHDSLVAKKGKYFELVRNQLELGS
jgi:ATP-binding cassette subfamily B protein